MDEKNLLICDEEFRYANALGEYIMRRSELAFRVYIFTNMQSVMEFKEKKEIHFLIIDEEFAKNEREQLEAQHVFVLSRNESVELKEREYAICKFQSATKILATILELSYEKKNINILRNRTPHRQNLIGIYSPIHRIGKTEFALEISKILAKKERTLYINLEEYSGVGGQFVLSEGRNLGDLLYFMRQDGENMAVRISTMVRKLDDLDYIPPIPMSTDLKEITIEEWKTLLVDILPTTCYENVVLDIWGGVRGLTDILQMCDRIYMPILEDSVSKQKVKQYEEEVERMHLDELKQKTKKIIATEDMRACARKMMEEE